MNAKTAPGRRRPLDQANLSDYVVLVADLLDDSRKNFFTSVQYNKMKCNLHILYNFRSNSTVHALLVLSS